MQQIADRSKWPSQSSSPVPSTNRSEDTATFVQISDNLMVARGDGRWIDEYYKAAYAQMPGYHKPQHFMEIPYWIAKISGMMGPEWDQALHVVTDVDSSTRFLTGKPGILLYSTMEANKLDIIEMVRRLPNNRIIMGGYVEPSEFTCFNNVEYLEKLNDLSLHLKGLNLSAPPSYELFRGMSVIPRLTLSTGCLLNCSFCMVPRELRVLTPAQVNAQVESFRPLHFDLVYLDDKTFSQASNWRSLQCASEAIQEYNPNFMGFIVQTTPHMAALPNRMQEFKDLGIKYVELGVESLDDRTLTAFRKPYRKKDLDFAISEARRLGIKIVPNFVFGFPGECYSKSVKWVSENKEVIPAVNINFLSGIYEARDDSKLPTARTPDDRDQNCFRKSWLSQDEQLDMLQAVRSLFFITSEKDFCPEANAEEMKKMTPEEVIDRSK